MTHYLNLVHSPPWTRLAQINNVTVILQEHSKTRLEKTLDLVHRGLD